MSHGLVQQIVRLMCCGMGWGRASLYPARGVKLVGGGWLIKILAKVYF